MNDNREYMDREEYSQIMNYCWKQEEIDRLHLELLKSKNELSVAKEKIKFWKGLWEKGL